MFLPNPDWSRFGIHPEEVEARERAIRTQTMLEPLKPIAFSDFDRWALSQWRMKP